MHKFSLIFHFIGEVVEEKRIEPPKHSSSHLKALWKKAIMEQIILIRLEREQKKLKSNLIFTNFVFPNFPCEFFFQRKINSLC